MPFFMVGRDMAIESPRLSAGSWARPFREENRTIAIQA